MLKPLFFPSAMNETSPASSPGFSAAPSSDPFQSAKASALKAAEELRAAAAQKATELRTAAETRAQHLKSSAGQKAAEIKSDLQERTDDLRAFADEAIGQARQQYQSLMTEAENLAREKPRQALLTAFGVGVLVGLILRR
jgi:ElaB/YqjD/DUF883 family membrane-anchored ribosome-binding protein